MNESQAGGFKALKWNTRWSTGERLCSARPASTLLANLSHASPQPITRLMASKIPLKYRLTEWTDAFVM